MAESNTCQVITGCLVFDLRNYSLNNGKTYSNPLLSFQIICPGVAAPVTVYIQPNTIRLTWPYQPMSPVPYPPVVLSCPAGGAIVKTIPQTSTQQQIDDIINGMIFTCAQAQAQASACQPRNQFNDVVYFANNCAVGTVLVYNDILPAWITLDVANKRLVGAAQVFAGVTKAEANFAAQTALDSFGTAAVAAGTLQCVTLDWNALVWSNINIQITTNGAGGSATHSELGGHFTNAVVTNPGGVSTSPSDVNVNGNMTYTGPAQNCQLSITVSGTFGDPYFVHQVSVVVNGLTQLNYSVPNADGTYIIPFTVPISVAVPVLVIVQNGSTFHNVGGGSSWNGTITTL